MSKLDIMARKVGSAVKALAVLSEDQNSIPSTHMTDSSQTPVIPAPLAFSGTCTHITHTDTHK